MNATMALAHDWWTLLRFVFTRYRRRYTERLEAVRAEIERKREGEWGVPRKMLPGKKQLDIYRPPDRRLSRGGVWRRTLPPFDRVRITKVGERGRGVFKGGKVVCVKAIDGGKSVNYKEDDFLLLFEPVVSGVMEG